jgi:parallel beta-helix repeat protein
MQGIRSINLLLYYCSLALILFSLSCQQNMETVFLSTEDNIRSKIETGNSGTLFLLSEGLYINPGTIKIPSGVIVEGQGNVIIEQTFAGNTQPIFDIYGSNGVAIKNITLKLGSSTSGIGAFSNEVKTRNIHIENIKIIGNLNKVPNINETSRFGVYIENGDNIKVIDSSIVETFGGLYLIGDNIDVIRNKLERVNFGNIVLGGMNLNVFDNQVYESGKASRFFPATGDAVTIGGNSANIVLKGNVFKSGYCYLLWAHSPIRNITLTDNWFESSVTSAVYVEGASSANVTSNTFYRNLAHGIVFVNSGNDITIKDNKLVDDTIYIESDLKKVKIYENKFEKLPQSSDAILGTFSSQHIYNNIKYLNSEDSPNLTLETQEGEQILLGQTYKFSRDEFPIIISLRNKGTIPLSLRGLPQFQLTELPLEKDILGETRLGRSTYGPFYIRSIDQPNQLNLASDEEIHFIINLTDFSVGTEEVVVNIPTSLEIYNPFWFRIQLQ